MQVSEITLRAISAHKNRERESLRREQEDDPEPFTFSVPVSLAGLTLFADFRVSLLLNSGEAAAQEMCLSAKSFEKKSCQNSASIRQSAQQGEVPREEDSILPDKEEYLA